MNDSTPALTAAERSYGRVDPGLQLRGRWYSEASVARIKADAVAAALAPVERWVDRWDDATLARLTLDQRVPIRRARDDLRAALAESKEASRG